MRQGAGESLYVRDHGRFLAQAARRAIPEAGDPVPHHVALIVLAHVTYRYPDRGSPALDEVSLTPPGDRRGRREQVRKEHLDEGPLKPAAGPERDHAVGAPPTSPARERAQVFERGE